MEGLVVDAGTLERRAPLESAEVRIGGEDERVSVRRDLEAGGQTTEEASEFLGDELVTSWRRLSRTVVLV